MRLERLHRLINEGHAVGEKQNALHPIAAQKKIAQRDDGAVLPAPVVITTSALRSLSFSNASEMRRMARVWGRDYDAFEENGRLVFEDKRGLLDLPSPRLIGHHQQQNAATAIAALRAIEPHLPASAFEHGLLHVEWPARLQNLAKGHVAALAPAGADIWLDGGHNEDAGRALAQSMAELEDKMQRPLVIVCGSLASKDTGGFLRAFKGLAQEVVAVPVNADQYAKPAAEVAAAATANGIPAAACESVKSALAFLAARQWPAPPRVLIAGSLYLAGEVLALNGTPPE